ncbi:MAG: nucleoside recognition domain-containing protein [Myxococcota bacterium]|nr:nucleoside recognition domain-containing protein [Myxococcota bacterium]
MNQVFFAIIAIAFVVGALTGSMEAVSLGAFSGAAAAVDLAIGLIGYMALFLGLMKIAEDGGLLRLLARAIRPVMVRLFPDVPADHPAMGAMIMNIAANMLGLTNAATPLGIKAMIELNRINRTPGVATNAMCLFLAINTSGLALLPSGAVSVRAAEGSADPWGIVPSTLVATGLATVAGIIVAKMLQKLPVFSLARAAEAMEADPEQTDPTPNTEPPESPQVDLSPAQSEDTVGVHVLRWSIVAVLLVLAGPPMAAAVLDGPSAEALRNFSTTAGNWVIPSLVMAFLAFGFAQGVKVYESFVAGAKEGFQTGVLIIPYLVAILAAVGMFRGSGAMDFLTSGVGPFIAPLGLPAEVLPQALVRPLSGSGAFALMSELVTTHGPDSYIGYVSSTLQGSTDTTFYVLAVYFGAVGVSRTRHAVLAGLTADLFGVIGTVLACRVLFGHLAG